MNTEVIQITSEIFKKRHHCSNCGNETVYYFSVKNNNNQNPKQNIRCIICAGKNEKYNNSKTN